MPPAQTAGSAATRAQVEALAAEGLSLENIARRLHRSKHTVQLYLAPEVPPSTRDLTTVRPHKYYAIEVLAAPAPAPDGRTHRRAGPFNLQNPRFAGIAAIVQDEAGDTCRWVTPLAQYLIYSRRMVAIRAARVAAKAARHEDEHDKAAAFQQAHPVRESRKGGGSDCG